MTTVKAWLAQAERALLAAQQRGFLATELSAKREAQWLLLDAVEQSTAWLVLADDHVLQHDQVLKLGNWLEQRCSGVPLAHLTGKQGFWSLSLQVNASTLVPRPDTELLVEAALHSLQSLSLPAPRVLDLGTGSGAIALAIKQSFGQAYVVAVDASDDALAVAQHNAEQLALPVHLIKSDWFTALADQRFDVIVSNPPYLAADDPYLPSLRHEPRSALVAAENGLADLAQIIAQAPRYLNSGGWLWLEHGHNQGAPVRALLTQAGFAEVQSRHDLGGHERISGGCVSHAQ